MRYLSDILKQIPDDEYNEMLSFMEANRNNDYSPKVGLFWYNKSQKKLFGVIKHNLEEYEQPNCGSNKISCSELHEKVWSKNFYKQKFKNDGKGDYIGQYQDKPRGRIFYNCNTEEFEICVGNWIKEYPEAVDLIVTEFNLLNDDYKVVIKHH